MIAFYGENGKIDWIGYPAKQILLREANLEHHETKSELRGNTSDLCKTTSQFQVTTLKIQGDIWELLTDRIELRWAKSVRFETNLGLRGNTSEVR